ncbi:MAG TPA: helix-turn-helix transcriptional regulator [Solirubrobacteraceae bacterium]|jgi:transcriptional regulator with XRE-family HTH domain|nr:helix-turn-helix transcriptional regulator [Solirubrobacteraceae bacterium]
MDSYRAERHALLKEFGARLRELRLRTYSSQEGFADAARLHRTEIGYLEQGRREPGLMTLLVLADTLGITLDRLVSGVEVPSGRRPPPEERSGRE